jgi:hypothetical protein
VFEILKSRDFEEIREVFGEHNLLRLSRGRSRGRSHRFRSRNLRRSQDTIGLRSETSIGMRTFLTSGRRRSRSGRTWSRRDIRHEYFLYCLFFTRERLAERFNLRERDMRGYLNGLRLAFATRSHRTQYIPTIMRVLYQCPKREGSGKRSRRDEARDV